MAQNIRTIGQRMYAALEAKEGVDMEFLVGPENVKIPAHQFPLSVSSEVFKTKFSNHWKNVEKEETPRITLPSNTVEGVNAFIKGIYLDEIDPNLSIGVIKEVIILSHEYMVYSLLKICEDNVKVTVDNCLTLIEMENLEEISEVLWDRAWTTFKSNLLYLLGDMPIPTPTRSNNMISIPLHYGYFDNQNSCFLMPPCPPPPILPRAQSPSYSANWDAGTWKTVLELEGPEMVNIKEETLFRELISWTKIDPSREPLMKYLVPLIRFPLMDLNFIAATVLPTKILTDKDATDLLCQRYGTTQQNGRTVGFNSKPRFQQ